MTESSFHTCPWFGVGETLAAQPGVTAWLLGISKRFAKLLPQTETQSGHSPAHVIKQPKWGKIARVENELNIHVDKSSLMMITLDEILKFTLLRLSLSLEAKLKI